MTTTNDSALACTILGFAASVALLGSVAFAGAASWAGAGSAHIVAAASVPPLVIAMLWRLGRESC